MHLLNRFLAWNATRRTPYYKVGNQGLRIVGRAVKLNREAMHGNSFYKSMFKNRPDGINIYVIHYISWHWGKALRLASTLHPLKLFQGDKFWLVLLPEISAFSRFKHPPTVCVSLKKRYVNLPQKLFKLSLVGKGNLYLLLMSSRQQ